MSNWGLLGIWRKRKCFVCVFLRVRWDFQAKPVHQEKEALLGEWDYQEYKETADLKDNQWELICQINFFYSFPRLLCFVSDFTFTSICLSGGSRPTRVSRGVWFVRTKGMRSHQALFKTKMMTSGQSGIISFSFSVWMEFFSTDQICDEAVRQ